MVVLGVMSGTSLDGVDLALVNFQNSARGIGFEICASETLPYSELWHKKLENAHTLMRSELNQLNKVYGIYLGKLIQSFLGKCPTKPDIIASHGHTVLHQPENGITVQIGNGPEIYNTLGIPVVCDFRVQDVALGGQGAPLVPIGDRLLFSKFDCCVNLGGFINLSFEKNGQRLAYDVCPMNIVMNELAIKLGKDFDKSGEFARSGTLNEPLLNALNSLDYYSQQPPKSLGKEWVLLNVRPILNNINPKEALRTFVEHSAQQLANNIRPNAKVLLTGGGVFNKFFIERLIFFSEANLIVPKREIVEFKEALIFGLLGYLKWENKTNVLASVTGASQNHSSGVVYK